MALEYLAMYVEVQFNMGQTDNPIVPVRHFASSRARLGEAVKNNSLFTDMDEAIREWDLIANGGSECSVLLDSSLPGRDKIIKGAAKKHTRDLHTTLALKSADHAQRPAVSRPTISGFALFFGVKTADMRYPRSILDVTTWKNFFKQPGRYVEFSGPSFEQNFAVVGPNLFEAFTIRDWNIKIIAGG